MASSGISETPKYLVSALPAINNPESTRYGGLAGVRPSIQKIDAHTHRASIGVSHITLPADTSNPGVSSAASAATNGSVVKRRASRYTPSTSAKVGNRKPRCMASSDQPEIAP